eukprot:SAG11_NODE_1992_length_3953_cov_10.200571_5_plen_93_part_00
MGSAGRCGQRRAVWAAQAGAGSTRRCGRQGGWRRVVWRGQGGARRCGWGTVGHDDVGRVVWVGQGGVGGARGCDKGSEPGPKAKARTVGTKS